MSGGSSPQERQREARVTGAGDLRVANLSQDLEPRHQRGFAAERLPQRGPVALQLRQCRGRRLEDLMRPQEGTDVVRALLLWYGLGASNLLSVKLSSWSSHWRSGLHRRACMRGRHQEVRKLLGPLLLPLPLPAPIPLFSAPRPHFSLTCCARWVPLSSISSPGQPCKPSTILVSG